MAIIKETVLIVTRSVRAMGAISQTVYAIPEGGAVRVRVFGKEPKISPAKSTVWSIGTNAADIAKRYADMGHPVQTAD